MTRQPLLERAKRHPLSVAIRGDAVLLPTSLRFSLRKLRDGRWEFQYEEGFDPKVVARYPGVVDRTLHQVQDFLRLFVEGGSIAASARRVSTCRIGVRMVCEFRVVLGAVLGELGTIAVRGEQVSALDVVALAAAVLQATAPGPPPEVPP